MNRMQSELHDAKMKAAASMPQYEAGADVRGPRYEAKLRPSGYWAVYRNGSYVKTAKTKDEALAKEIAEVFGLQDEARRRGEVDVRNANAIRIVDDYCRTYPAEPKSAKANITTVTKRLKTYLNGLRLRDLNDDWVDRTRTTMQLEGYAYGYFIECINRLVTAIRCFCRNNLSPPLIPFARPRKARGRERVLSAEECIRIMRWADGTEAYDKSDGSWVPHDKISQYDANCRLMVGRELRLGLTVGSRPGIYEGLSWRPNGDYGHIDAGQGMFHRLPAGASAEQRKGAPAVKLSPGLLAEVRRWRDLDGDETYVFRTSRGGPLPQQTLAEIFAAAMDHLGIVGVTGHTLRHTCITRLVEKGVSAMVISSLCGITVDMLRRRYDHSDAAVVQVFAHPAMDAMLLAAA